MRGWVVAVGLALSVLLALSAVAAQLALLQRPPQPAAAATRGSVLQGEFGVGGVIHVYVNGELRYRGPMNSFTENAARILYGFLAMKPLVNVTDAKGNVVVLNLTAPASLPSDVDSMLAVLARFYLPIAYDPTNTYFDNLSNGAAVPPVCYYVNGTGWSLVLSSERFSYPTYNITATNPEKIQGNSTHEWFYVTVSFKAPATHSGPLSLTYTRLFRSKDGDAVYIPIMVDTVSVSFSAGDYVTIQYMIYVKNPPNGGGSRTFTLLVYELLNPFEGWGPTSFDHFEYADPHSTSFDLSANQWTPPLLEATDLHWSLNYTVLAVRPWCPHRVSVALTNMSSGALYGEYNPWWSYDRYKYPYILEIDEQVETTQYTVTLNGKNITIEAVVTGVEGRLIHGAAFKIGCPGPTPAGVYALFSVKKAVYVPQGKAARLRVTIAFG